MTLLETLKTVRKIRIETDSPPVFLTAASELAALSGAEIEKVERFSPQEIPVGVFYLWDSIDDVHAGSLKKSKGERGQEKIYLRIDRSGSGVIAVSRPHLLFGFITYLLDSLRSEAVDDYSGGIEVNPAFLWQRSTYDFFLTQEGRIQRGLDKEAYVRRLAECGFTHVEVNGLAFPMALETGPKGETYPMFYTYCPALDQFVSSGLNKGLYPNYYLSANMANLKRNAELAVKYGLVPGLLCFEPRSVPEQFFARYPMLRGARVDHPFRSFKPRYNMTITHPKVREHYAEMLTKLMAEVPELSFLSIWTNDSGAGFEHTKSLYVGRNGGAYLIREWKDDEEIARVAGENALRFFRTLREAGRKINPEFRVITRLESFYGEHEAVWNGIGDGLDVETSSLMARGWEMPYSHPRYPDSKDINAGTVYQLQFDSKEGERMGELESKAAVPHYYFAAGPNSMFAPLVGIPYPTLTWRRLELLRDNGVRFLAQHCGTHPPELVPFNVNHEMMRAFQFDPSAKAEAEIQRLACKWAGEKYDGVLLEAWEKTEQAIMAFPNVSPLYSTFGFVWYRLWARPLVPNIEAIPLSERAYYQDFMCTTPHNPNNVDLSRDVLFQLTTADKCRKAVQRIDSYLWGPIDKAIAALEAVLGDALGELGEPNVIEDQYVRLRALRCWFLTQWSVAAWIAEVHGYINAETATDKEKCRARLRDMMEKEIDNSGQLLHLLDSGVDFMATTDVGETPLMHGRNLKELLSKRIALMRTHIDDEPYIDQDYIERNAGLPII